MYTASTSALWGRTRAWGWAEQRCSSQPSASVVSDRVLCPNSKKGSNGSWTVSPPSWRVRRCPEAADAPPIQTVGQERCGVPARKVAT
jgi:hypothetical protein